MYHSTLDRENPQLDKSQLEDKEKLKSFFLKGWNLKSFNIIFIS